MSEGSNEESGRNEAWKVWAGVLVLTALGIALTLPFVGAPPPDSIRIATGPETGAYHAAGVELARELLESGVEAELVSTAGSSENFAALAGDVDVAFVQGGIAQESEEVQGLASLYYEPLWVFARSGLAPRRLSELEGRAIEVGAEGSGTRAVAAELLAANGVSESGWRGGSPDEAVDALLNRECDALFLVVSPDSPLVHRLFEAADHGLVEAVSLERAHSFSRHFHYLEHLTRRRA